MRLRIDPWDPEYGASIEFEPDLGAPAGLALDVEVDGGWAPVSASASGELPCCAFIDGVRRIDARLFAEDEMTSAPALAGSWAVGCARSSRPPTIGEVRVGRELVIGGGLELPGIEMTVGCQRMHFEPRAVAGESSLDPIQGLQNAMREAESQLAADVITDGSVELVVSDGPLTYFATGPAVGMIKRQSRSYLDPERAKVLGELAAGERTPIFKLGEQRLERYSWYLRLAEQRVIDGTMAGIVRLEVAMHDGLEAAVRLADLTSATLPRFAPRPGRDPRAPQNLFPISALESVLRHRLGDPALVRRALEVYIYEEVLGAG
jgi:hypothetical protein